MIYKCDLCDARWMVAFAIDDDDELMYLCEWCDCRKVGMIGEGDIFHTKFPLQVLTRDDLRTKYQLPGADASGKRRDQAGSGQGSLFPET